MVRCRGSVLMSAVYVLLIPMGLAGHLHPYMQRVMETRAMSRVDLVERYREVSGAVATVEDGFWWGEAKQWLGSEENGWRWVPQDLMDQAVAEVAILFGKDHSDEGFIDFYDALLELGERPTAGERFQRTAARRYLKLYDENEEIQLYVQGWISQPNAVLDVEDGKALLWHKRPHGVILRELVEHEGLLMVLDAEEDDWLGVEMRFERFLRLARTAAWETDAIMAFTSMSIEALALVRLEELLKSHDVPAATRRELARLLERESLDLGLDECIRVAEKQFLGNTDLLVHVFEGREMAERIGERIDFHESLMPRDLFGDAPGLFETLEMAREEFELIKQEVVDGSIELDGDVSAHRQEVRDRYFVMISPDLLPRLRKSQLRLAEGRRRVLGLLVAAGVDEALPHDGEHEEEEREGEVSEADGDEDRDAPRP